MKHVAIVGAGLIGRSWAVVFARAGWTVSLFDPADGVAAGAVPLIASELNMLSHLGLVGDPAAALARVSATASLEQAVERANFVQEGLSKPSN